MNSSQFSLLAMTDYSDKLHGSFQKMCGEASDSHISSLKELKDVVLWDILERYKDINAFNASKCGHF